MLSPTSRAPQNFRFVGMELPATGGHVGTISTTFCIRLETFLFTEFLTFGSSDIFVYTLSIVDLAVF